MQMIDILLKYILWHELLNDSDAQSDFEAKNCHKKTGQLEPFLSARAFLSISKKSLVSTSNCNLNKVSLDGSQ